MNETRRDALVEKVTGILDARSQLTATELSHRDIYQDANEIVEAVTRHRDAEIREALLQPEVVEAAAKAIRATADAFFEGPEVDQITSVKSAKQAFDRLYRQQARAALLATRAEPAGDDTDLTTAYMTGYLAGKDAAAAIAAFEAVLLSDEVVEAAADAIEAEVYSASHPGGRYSEKGLARAALQAAIAAAKGTEGRE